MVGTVPLIDVVGHLDLTAIEPKSSELFDAVFVYKEFRPGSAWRALYRRRVELCLTSRGRLLGPKAQDPRHLPVEPEFPPGCSDRMATGPSAMLHR